MSSQKYPRTYHLPWSEGKSNDDKVAKDVSSLLNRPIVISEKLDGGNCSLELDGCFARTHSHSPKHPAFDVLKALHAKVKDLIPLNVQVFGELLYAKHTLSYIFLPGYFLVFGIRNLEDSYWLSWSSVKEFATNLDIPTVPALWEGIAKSEKELQTITTDIAHEPSCYGAVREGVVVRIQDAFADDEFNKSVMKWVRKDHVDGEEHWMHKEIVKNGLK